jgi:hypothetical protein
MATKLPSGYTDTPTISKSHVHIFYLTDNGKRCTHEELANNILGGGLQSSTHDAVLNRDLSVGRDLYVTGDVTVTGSLTSGDIVTTGDISKTGDLTIESTTEVILDAVTEVSFQIGSSEQLVVTDGLVEVQEDLGVLGDLSISGFLNLGSVEDVVISSGEITITGSYIEIDTEGGASTDDLDTINGGTQGDFVIIKANDSSNDIVVKDGSGNIRCAGDFTLTHRNDAMSLFYDGTNWLEISRSDNNA